MQSRFTSRCKEGQRLYGTEGGSAYHSAALYQLGLTLDGNLRRPEETNTRRHTRSHIPTQTQAQHAHTHTHTVLHSQRSAIVFSTSLNIRATELSSSPPSFHQSLSMASTHLLSISSLLLSINWSHIILTIIITPVRGVE